MSGSDISIRNTAVNIDTILTNIDTILTNSEEMKATKANEILEKSTTSLKTYYFYGLAREEVANTLTYTYDKTKEYIVTFWVVLKDDANNPYVTMVQSYFIFKNKISASNSDDSVYAEIGRCTFF